MGLIRNPFRKPPPPDDAVRARVKAWVSAALEAPAGLDLTISEIECPDPKCPGLESYILILREGTATQVVKIRKRLADIGEADIIEAVRYL